MTSEALTSTDYIRHHLQNLTCGLQDGHFHCAHDGAEAKAMGFWALNVDTLGVSLVLGLFFLFFFRRVAKSAEQGVPTGAQNFIEWIKNRIHDAIKIEEIK